MLRSVFLVIIVIAFTGVAFAEEHPEDIAAPDDIRQEELHEAELPKTQFNYELDISLRPNAEDVIKRDFIRSPVRIKYGITDNWELSAEPLMYFDNFFKGYFGLYVTDVVLGTKYNLGQPLGGGVNTAFSFRAVLPMWYDTRISDGYHHYSPALLFSKHLKDFHSIGLGFSIGTDTVRGPGPPGALEPNNTLSSSIGLMYPADGITYTSEVAYTTDEPYGGSTEVAYITPGLFLDVKDWFKDIQGLWTFSTGVRLGMMDAPKDVEFILRLKLHLRLDYKFDINEMRFRKK